MTNPATAAEQNQLPETIAPESKPKKGLPKWAVSLIGIVVVGGGFYAYNYFTDDAVQAKAGECASITGTGSKVEYKAADCGSGEANYKIEKVLDSGSCGEEFAEYTQTGSGANVTLCLVPIEGR
ncbi:MAG: hypothetical protein M3443_16070 [Actinomycetota bacterium]|nr:hypothetical protein [Actinomycetota bacterium]